jgi:phytoene/squalene synthetase
VSLEACAGLVARGDPDRFLAAMAAPPAARVRLLPLYAFNVEVARAPWVTEEPLIAEMRLQWWRDALEEIAGGGPVRSHEVTTPLAEVLDAEAARALDRLIAARRGDAHREGPADEAALDRHLADTAGELLWQAARALGATGGEQGVRCAGWAQGLANWLLAAPALAARGVPPLWPGADVSALARRGSEGLAAARRAGVPREARPAMLAVWRAGGVLARAERAPGGPLEGSEFARRGGLLLRSLTGRW